MKNKKITPILLIAFCAIFLAAILIAPKIINGPKTDKRSGCTDAISGRTVILLDHSEDISIQTKNEILARVKRIVDENTAIGELVSVFYISEISKRNLEPAFSHCKPKNIANPLAESEKIIIKNYKKNFIEPLEIAINAKIKESKESPIAQALVDLSLLDQLRNDKPGKLLVFSDLMENTNKFSLYNCTSTKDSITTYQNATGSKVSRPQWKNIKVELHVVPRQNVKKSSMQCRDGYWAWFFGDNEDGTVTKVDLPG